MLTNMTIEDKVSTINELLLRIANDDNYSSRIILPEDMSKEEFILYARSIANNAAKLLEPNRIKNLEGDEYAEAYATIQSFLDGVLNKFPEYTPSESVRHM